MTAIAEKRGTYPEELVYRGTNMFHKPCHGDRVSRMGLVAGSYLTSPESIAGPLQPVSQNELDYNHQTLVIKRFTHVNPDLGGILAPKWRKAIRVIEFTIAAMKNICQPESKATISTVHEEYW